MKINNYLVWWLHSNSSIRDNCGIALAHSLEDAYLMAYHQNHRGQDTAGIAYMNPRNGIYVVRWHGKVNSFDLRDLTGIFRQFGGGNSNGMYTSHVKYTTVGSKDSMAVLEAAHPHYIGDVKNYYRGSHLITVGPRKTMVHNGTVVNEQNVRRVVSDLKLKTDCDTESLLAYCDRFGVEDAIRNIHAAYSAIIQNSENHTATVIRDRYGIRPLWRGVKNGKTIIASEDSAIRRIGGIQEEEVMPGSMITIYPDGTFDSKQVVDPDPHPSIFEWIYIMDYDSSFYGRLVRDVHVDLGKQLYREFGSQMPRDVTVTHVPHRPEIAARVFAEEGGFEYRPLLYKVSDERAFLQLTQDQREGSIRRNLYIDPIHACSISGRKVVVIDDSIVRGTNAPYAIELIRNEGAEWIGFLSCASMLGGEIPVNGLKKSDETMCTACFTGREPIPTKFLSESELYLTGNGMRRIGCNYGVAMPPSDTFATIKWGRDVEKIRQNIGADFLGYMSLEGMVDCVRPAIPAPSAP